MGLTFGEPRRDHRVRDGFSNGNSNLENTLVVDVDDQSTVGREEGTAQQTSPMAHTSSLRLVYRELTVRVIIFTAGSMHEQFHCVERLFQQLFIGKEATVSWKTQEESSKPALEKICAHTTPAHADAGAGADSKDSAGPQRHKNEQLFQK